VEKTNAKPSGDSISVLRGDSREGESITVEVPEVHDYNRTPRPTGAESSADTGTSFPENFNPGTKKINQILAREERTKAKENGLYLTQQLR